jgi:Fe2+ transport system protein B
MIMEMPAFQAPSAQVVLAKTWLRIKDFIVIAWPLLILGSLFLSLTEWLHWQEGSTTCFHPLPVVGSAGKDRLDDHFWGAAKRVVDAHAVSIPRHH